MQQKDLFAHYKPVVAQADSYITGLKLTNSLRGGELTNFIPISGRQVKFYYCGPTVYSNSHLGHARTYIGIDIIRRTLRDYFGYDLISVMNITDIDDKIILQANTVGMDFLQFTKLWEEDFFNSMDALNVELPDVITRVTDYVPEIVSFIQKIIDNKFAYESNGSVYFDVQKYQEAGHAYPKMRPKGNNKESLLEGEGSSQVTKQNERKSELDFALWKSSKPDEPKWVSPWGEGRPGWHIECSVMASEVLGNPIDLHAGGIDLIFPHHDNSIAQSEACFQCDQWINYFIHLGHLDIEGSKMSKSLKNFITIGEVLKRYTARQVRLNFALHQYDNVMNYSEHQMQEAIQKDRYIMEFFQNIKVYLKGKKITDVQKWSEDDLKLHTLFHEKKALIHGHLQNNLDFPSVLKQFDELINATNVLIAKQTVKQPLLIQIQQYAQFITGLLGLNYTKLNEKSNVEPLMNKLTLLRDQVNQAARENTFDKIFDLCKDQFEQTEESTENSLVRVYNQYRESVIDAANQKSKVKVFQLSDKLRDESLIEIGLKIEDKPNGGIWKQYDPMDLKLEKEQLLQIKLNQEAEKLKKEQLKLEAEQKKLQQAQIAPADLFKDQLDKYSLFDENGIPTHDQEGKELSKKQKKYVKDQWDKQKVLYEKHKQ